LSKKRSGIQTFFSTTVHALMPRIHISEHAYGKRYKSSRQKFTQTDEIKDTNVVQKLPKRNGQTEIFGSQPLYMFQDK
jgi:hypothetical protein